MIFDPLEKNPGARLLFILACLVVVVYGLKFAAPILLPSALALFLAVLSLPIMMWQLHRGVPKVIATLVTVLVFVGGIGLLILIGSQSVSELQNNMEGYVEGLSTRTSDWTDRAEAFTGLEIGDYIANDVINPAVFAGVVGDTIGRIAQFLGTTFLVFLIMAFMLGEATVFPDKFRYVLGVDDGDQDRFTKVVTEVQSYLGIKTIVSLVTGITLGLWAYMLNLDFPLLLGMVAFLLNYVPTVGSIIAAIPAVILSIILFGTVAHGVTERTREIGVRRALGATSANVVGVVSRDAMGAAIVGAGIGAVGAWLVSRLLRPLLFGVTPNDPWTLGGLAVSVLLVCAVAALFAAWRAVRIEPSLALRSE